MDTCALCGAEASIACRIGKCAPLTQYCAHCYEQTHLPIDERDATMTISEIRAVTGIAERTIRSAATDGPLSAVSRQSGRTWLIDTESKEYEEWLRKHDEQPRVKGKRNDNE